MGTLSAIFGFIISGKAAILAGTIASAAGSLWSILKAIGAVSDKTEADAEKFARAVWAAWNAVEALAAASGQVIGPMVKETRALDLLPAALVKSGLPPMTDKKREDARELFRLYSAEAKKKAAK